MKTTPIPAPTKASEAIRLALADLEKCEANPHYRINMGLWHGRKASTGPCYVCLAGAVMAQTLGTPRTATRAPYEFRNSDNPAWESILEGLNSVRIGYILSVDPPQFKILGERIDRFNYLPICPTPYHISPGQFKADMRRLADMYEAKEKEMEMEQATAANA